MTKIAVHSTIDLITNSSTEIFMYSGSSKGILEEMINEIFKAFGIDKTCDDVFSSVVLCEDCNPYEEYSKSNPDVSIDPNDVEQLYEDVKSGKVSKPDWFNDAEEVEDSWSYYSPSTYLYLTPKKEEYKNLSELISKFLYSTHQEATYNG